MESKRTVEAKVGIFVAVGLALTVLSILLLGGDRIIFTRYYTLKVQFKEVQGLAKGSVVSLSGIGVGNVEEIKFDPKDRGALVVVMRVEERARPQITQGSTAEIKTQGALGDKYVYITPGPIDAPPLPDDGFLRSLDGTDFMSVLSSRGEGFNEVFQIIHEVNQLVKVLNSGNRVDKILENLTESSAGLTKTIHSTQATVDGVRKMLPQDEKIKTAISRLDNILRKIDQGEGTLGALINDPTLHRKLKALLDGSTRSQYIKGVLQSTVEKSGK